MWNKRNSMVWSKMLARDSESCLERTFVNHSVSLHWASPVSQPVCYILNTQRGVRRIHTCSYSEKTVIIHSVILYWASPVSQTVYYPTRDQQRPRQTWSVWRHCQHQELIIVWVCSGAWLGLILRTILRSGYDYLHIWAEENFRKI